MGLLSTALSVLVVLAVAASLLVVRRIDGPDGRWGRRLRSRFVMGIPWGTLVTVLFVLGVYLFVQGGYRHWYDPVTVAFRAWSFLYPLGIVTAPFAHNGPGHLLGNLFGTLVLGTIAEYAWGHFPTERGRSTFSSVRTNPWVRALVIFPLAAVVVGLVGSVFSIGPVIGFSLVVFAYGGFALSRYPLGTIVAVVATDAVSTAYFSLVRPIVTANPQPSPPSPPWWAEVAIQGHALGLFAGVILGAFLFSRRGQAPSALRVWTGVVLFAMSRALWAVYWFRGENTFVLFRGPGVILVALLALLVTVGLTATDRPVADSLRRFLGRVRAAAARPFGGGGAEDPSVEADGAGEPGSAETDVSRDHAGSAETDGSGDPGSDGDRGDGGRWGSAGPGGSDDEDPSFLDAVRTATWRQVSLVVLVLAFALLGGPGIGANLFVAEGTPPGDAVQVRDYRVAYAEGVTNDMVAVVNVSGFNESTVVETSGVIVTSEQRRIWLQAVSKGRLAFDGRVTVRVGSVGWAESVTAIRRGWSASGGGAAYKVWLRPEGGQRRFAFNSTAATAEPVIRGRNVSVLAPPERSGFHLRVTRDNATLGTAPIPEAGNTTAVGGLEFTNREGTIYAVANDTRVKVASEEEYE